VGYSSRYHVASLAAVFLALGIGILIGTGLKTVVSDTTNNLAASIRDDLQGSLDEAHAQVGALNRQLDRERSFGQAAYPGLVRGLLRGERVAVIEFGEPLDNALRSDIQQVVGPGNITGADVQSFDVVAEPPDLRGLVADLKGTKVRGTQVRGLAKGGDLLTAVAERAGAALARGGAFFRSISDTLLASQSGAPAGIDAVIVARHQTPGLDPAQAATVDRLEAGLLDGLRRSGIPVVGVERADTPHSSIGLFQEHGLASVDDLDLYSGRVALAYALRGAEGSFGVKATADHLLPPLHGPRVPPPRTGTPK
jgi:hypothetical protein